MHARTKRTQLCLPVVAVLHVQRRVMRLHASLTSLISTADNHIVLQQIVVDESSLEFVRGATVDFQEDMMRSSFSVINNPNSESACGCGSSFALKNFTANPALD
jgi:hypothetical protein